MGGSRTLKKACVLGVGWGVAATHDCFCSLLDGKAGGGHNPKMTFLWLKFLTKERGGLQR